MNYRKFIKIASMRDIFHNLKAEREMRWIMHNAVAPPKVSADRVPEKLLSEIEPYAGAPQMHSE